MENVNEAVSSAQDMQRNLLETVNRFSEQFELERRMRENPIPVLAAAAGIGFVLGGGLWPTVRPLLRGALKTLVTPTNLLGIAAALGTMNRGGGADSR